MTSKNKFFLWLVLNKDSVLTILFGIGAIIAIAVVFNLAKILQP